MKVGEIGHLFKLIIISMKSIIELTHYLLNNEDFEFVLIFRFMQDCLENLFSVICSIHTVPNAI